MRYFLLMISLAFTCSIIAAAETAPTPSSMTQSKTTLAPNASSTTLTTKSSPAPKILKKSLTQSNAAKAKPTPPPVPAALVGPPEPPKEDIAEILYPDEIADKLSIAVVGLANRIDSFFGTERGDDEKNGSTLRIVPSYTYYEHQKSITELGINLNLKLINLESRAKRLEKAIRDEFTDKPQQSIEKLIPQKMNQAAPTEEDWHYNFESKLASRPAIYYSGKLRARKNFTGKILLHHFAFSAGWDTDDQWSQITSFSSDKALDEFLLFRFSNDLNWFLSEKLVQATHGPSLIQSINKYNSVSYNFRLTFGNEKNKLQHLSTVYSINYRHGTPSQRIFIDLIPTYAYPKDDYFTEVKSFEIRFEYFFGDIK